MTRFGKCILLLSVGSITPLHSEPLDTVEGFSSLHNMSKSYARKHEERVVFCSNESRTGNAIPLEPKLLSFSVAKQKTIILYLWLLTRKQCSESELEQLMNQLQGDPNSEKYIAYLKRMSVFDDVTFSTELLAGEELTDEELEYVNELIRTYHEPFDGLETFDLIMEANNSK